MAALLKSAESKDSVGSNPTLSATPTPRRRGPDGASVVSRSFAMPFDCPHVADIAPEALFEGGFQLGAWVATYRERGGRGELDDDQRAALEAILGWSW